MAISKAHPHLLQELGERTETPRNGQQPWDWNSIWKTHFSTFPVSLGMKKYIEL